MNIVVINRSPQVSPHEAALMTNACAFQLERHVRPVWHGPPCAVTLCDPRRKPPPHSLAIVLLPESDDEEERREGYLGYHTEDDDGVRWGRVYTKPILEDGGSMLGLGDSISVTLSHEVVEAYVDPDMNLWAEGARGTYWSYEACDPVEASTYYVSLRGAKVGVSNFVYPTWFDLEHLPHERFDHLSKLRRPFQVLDHGYAIYRRGLRTLTRWGSRYNAERKRAKLRAKRAPLARSAKRRVEMPR